MTGTSDDDFKYFLQHILDKHADKEKLPKEILVPTFENLQSTVVDNQLIQNCVKGIWFNTQRVTAVWKNFLANHATKVFASRDNYLSTVLHMLYRMNEIKNLHDRFLCCLSTVTSMAGVADREGYGQFIPFTAAIMMYFFKKELETSFKGDWKGLKTYLLEKVEFRFYDVTRGAKKLQCERIIEDQAKTVPKYGDLQTITYEKLNQEDMKLLVNEVVIFYIDVIRPHLASGTEEERPEALDTGLATSSSDLERAESSELSAQPPAASGAIQEGLQELDTSLEALTLSGELERAASSELSAASAAASRAIHERAESSESGGLSPASREVEEQKAKENLISAVAETAAQFLKKCPPGFMGENSNEAAEQCRSDLAVALENFKREQARLESAYQKAEALGVSKSYAGHLKKRIQGTREEVRKQKAVAMSAAASRVYAPLKTVPQEKPQVPGNKILHCRDGPDPWLLIQGATFRTGEFMKNEFIRAAYEPDRHLGCEHRKKHPIPNEVQPSKLKGFSQKAREHLHQAELDRCLLLRTRSMIYDSKCDVDKLVEIMENYRKEIPKPITTKPTTT